MNVIPATSSAQQTQAVSEEMQVEQAGAAKQIPDDASAGAGAGDDFKGKHIAQRGVSQWFDYGDPKEWDEAFEDAVKEGVANIKAGLRPHFGILIR